MIDSFGLALADLDVTPTVRAAAAWTPAALPSLLAWFDPSYGVYSDAGTTPAVVGDPVYRWVTRNNSSIYAEQATLANRPILRQGANGRYYLEFDGSNDKLLCPSDQNTNTWFAVDIYHEYADTTSTSATFYWEPTHTAPFACPECGGSGCTVCTLTTQTGCFAIRDAEAGMIPPFPGSYDEDTGLWTSEGFSVARDPDQVKLYYQAGHLSNRFLSGQSLNPVDDYLAMAVVWLAVARMEYSVCSCNNVRNVTQELRRDLTESTKDAAYVRTPNMDIFTNPFGTRVGEVKAWQRVSKLMANNWKGGVRGRPSPARRRRG